MWLIWLASLYVDDQRSVWFISHSLRIELKREPMWARLSLDFSTSTMLIWRHLNQATYRPFLTRTIDLPQISSHNFVQLLPSQGKVRLWTRFSQISLLWRLTEWKAQETNSYTLPMSAVTSFWILCQAMKCGICAPQKLYSLRDLGSWQTQSRNLCSTTPIDDHSHYGMV